MKRFLLTIFLLSPIAALAFDDLGLKVPVWKDYAPTAFINVKEPKGLGKLNVTAKYWYERKLAFEDGISECQAIESYEDRFTCYEILKVKQFKQNTDYNAKIEAQMNATSGIPEMQNRTDTMLPINMFNGYTHMIPNELRGY